MSLLDQLWDDTVAGPRPDNGLGRLRKFRTFNLRSNSSKESYGGNLNSYSEAEDAVRVTRSIMIVKPPGFDNQSNSPPVSPARSTSPASPFSGSSNRGSFRFRRRSTSDACERTCEARRTSPPPPPPDNV